MKVETTNLTSLPHYADSGRDSSTGDCGASLVIETLTLLMIVKLGGSKKVKSEPVDIYRC